MAINLMCTNTRCKFYWEDNCILNLQEDRINIDKTGRCETFEEGVCNWYEEGAIGGCAGCQREDVPCDNCIRNEENVDKEDPDLEDNYYHEEVSNG